MASRLTWLLPGFVASTMSEAGSRSKPFIMPRSALPRSSKREPGAQPCAYRLSSPAQLGHGGSASCHRTSHFGYCAIWGMRPSAIAILMPEPMSALPSAAAGIWETLAIWLVGSVP